MNELYFWFSALLVGLILLRAMPAEKVTGVNKKIREKIPGALLAALYILTGIFLFAGFYLLLTFVNAPIPVRNIVTGAILGAFIGLIPLVDKRKNT